MRRIVLVQNPGKIGRIGTTSNFRNCNEDLKIKPLKPSKLTHLQRIKLLTDTSPADAAPKSTAAQLARIPSPIAAE